MSETVRELWVRRVVNQPSRKKRQVQAKVNQGQRSRYGVDEEKHGVDCGDKEKHIERNNQLYGARMMLVDKRE